MAATIGGPGNATTPTKSLNRDRWIGEMTTMQAGPTLREYAANTPTKRRRCILCTVSDEVYQQVLDGKNAGIPYWTIADWLNDLGYGAADDPITTGRLEKHFQRDHKR